MNDINKATEMGGIVESKPVPTLPVTNTQSVQVAQYLRQSAGKGL